MTQVSGVAWICIAIVLFFVVVNLKLFFNRIVSGDYSFRALFLFFRQKMWMTAGIAIFFGTLYLLFNIFHANLLSTESLLASFHYALENPLVALLWGCIIFVVNAVLILLVRRVIRFICALNDQ